MVETREHHVGSLSPEMALLGLLYSGPSYGYDLHKKIKADLNYVWHLSQSQAYSILKRLEKKGEISTEEVQQDRLPSRQELRLTERGRERFLSWIEAPSSGSIRSIRLEFITRVYFAKINFPEKIPHLIEQQRAGVCFHIDRIEKIIARKTKKDLYDRMSLTLRLFHLKNVLEWLNTFESELVEQY